MTENRVPFAGWFPDPQNSNRLRYWDGANWTQYIHPPQNAAAAPDNEATAKKWGLWDVAIGIAIFFIINIVGGVVIYASAEFIKSLQASNSELTELINTSTMLLAGATSAAALLIAFLGYPWFTTKRKGLGLRNDLGFSFRWFDIPLGIGAGLLTMSAGASIGYIYQQLTGAKPQGNTTSVSESSSSILVFVIIAITVAVIAPICEEVFFRGLLMRSLEKRFNNNVVAILISSVVFGVMHIITGGSAIFVVVSTTTFGVCFGVLAATTKRLGPSIIAHTTLNTIVVAALFLQTQLT